jgi:glycosyltransferase involved in cell wall biosynthesis
MSKPSVTVCIPVYNGAQHLAECLDSVCSQTYRDLEILILDDCSSDDSVKIVEQYRRNDNRIRLEQNEHNLGLVGNWEHCIALAGGEHIKFAFQDDVLLPECVEGLMRAIKGGVRFAFCDREFIFADGTDEGLVSFFNRNRRLIAELFADMPMISPEAFSSAVLDGRPVNIVGEPTVTLIHRDIFCCYGRFNADFVQDCDFEFWCRVGTNESTSYVPQALAKFRVHAASATSCNRAERLYRTRELDRLLIEHEFAFSPVFRKLREAARQRCPPIDLVDLFYENAHWMVAIALEKCAHAKIPEKTELDELQALAARYPAMLKRAPLKYTVARKWRSLNRLLR